MVVNFENDQCPTTLAPPIQLPIRNISTVTHDLRRGIPLSAGNPPQTLSFKVSASSNVTTIHDASVTCPSLDFQCDAALGGQFATNKSSSWHAVVNADHNRLRLTYDPKFRKLTETKSGTDMLYLTSSRYITVFPFVLHGREHLIDEMNEIGLGQNSTLLSSLTSTGSIASNTWGYFPGLSGVDATDQLDGSLVLGGYDAAKTAGNNITIPFTDDPSCSTGMVVTISDLRMNLVNGSNFSIIGPSKRDSFQSCIRPDSAVSTIPADIWMSFQQISGVTQLFGRSFGLASTRGELISAIGSYDGNLTLSLSPNLELTIPNHQLVVPKYDIDDSGQTVIRNASIREVLARPIAGKDTMPTLSRGFLTSAYLFVDNDLKQFTLWRINATERENPIAVAAPSCRDVLPSISASSTNSPTYSSATATFSSSAFPTSTSFENSGATGSRGLISKGAYAGVGLSVAFFGFLLIGGFLYLKQHRTRRWAFQGPETLATNETIQRADWLSSNYNVSHHIPELPSDQQPPQEMPPVQSPPYTLPSYELGTVTSNHGYSDHQAVTL